MVDVGELAPPFTLPDDQGRMVDLAALKGSWVALWWYPKASTPG